MPSRSLFEGKPRDRRPLPPGRRSRRGDAPDARCCSPPARSTRRSCWSFPASAGRDRLADARHRRRARQPRCRREPAGPSADPHRLQGVIGARRSTRSPTACSARRASRCSMRFDRIGPDVDGAEPVRHVHASPIRRWRRPTSNTTSSRCRPTGSATRCTPSRRSPCRSATCGPTASAPCMSRRATWPSSRRSG